MAVADRSGTSADVVVIGAGHNGLVAACYLARAGLDVLVVEASGTVGGMSTTTPLIADAPGHLLNPCALDMILLHAAPVVRDLELHRFGFAEREVDPPFVHLAPDGESLAFWRDPRRTADEIRRFSRHDAEAYLGFARILDTAMSIGLPLMLVNPTRPGRAALRAGRRAIAHPLHSRELAQMLGRSALEVLEERFEHPMVKGPLAVLTGIGPITERASGAYLMVLGLVHRLGVSRIVGGTQGLPNALMRCLTEAGGRVRLSSPVAQLVVRDGRVKGVTLVGGEELPARAVIATCDPHQTLNRLIPQGTLPMRLASRAEKIPTANSGLASLKIDLALSGRLDLGRHRAARADGLDLRKPTALVGSVEDVRHAHARAERGFLPERFPFYAAVPTAMDPSQAPEGQDTFYLWQGWVPVSPLEPWEDIAETTAKSVVAEAAKYYDGIEELEIGRAVETWPALAQRTGATDGNLFHVDLRGSRIGPNRPARGFGGYRTPIKGLFLSGNGTHPGSGVSGVPGQLAAAAVIRAFRSQRPR